MYQLNHCRVVLAAGPELSEGVDSAPGESWQSKAAIRLRLAGPKWDEATQPLEVPQVLHLHLLDFTPSTFVHNFAFPQCPLFAIFMKRWRNSLLWPPSSRLQILAFVLTSSCSNSRRRQQGLIKLSYLPPKIFHSRPQSSKKSVKF